MPIQNILMGLKPYSDDINIDFSEIQVPLSLHLTFGKGSIHPYIKAGGFMSFLIDQSYSRLSEGQRGESVYTEYYEDFTLDNALGFVAGAGVEFELGKARLLSLEGRLFQRKPDIDQIKFQPGNRSENKCYFNYGPD